MTESLRANAKLAEEGLGARLEREAGEDHVSCFKCSCARRACPACEAADASRAPRSILDVLGLRSPRSAVDGPSSVAIQIR